MYARRPTALLVVAVWIALVLVGLFVTVSSLKHHDFDGLNNAAQIPFALPWFLAPGFLVALATDSHETQAWFDADFGLLNA